ncbi:NAD(P)H-hydrate dehydratase [Tianweitania sediminis]|uniref:ADP-dependent (S)-NAD(P)H-hydrate dehydratase n=1 Tax=Tianweitania sediminis TaxID=1502156 RepID=A0A8J7UII3_9HYPH|nr:NAD(P)H-hydrate dehydratase [Tianweitania sediminis]MBP0437684.1 NAD(P)H-hydrate dehydratase [Tianweitania sediminis]
MTGQTVDRAFLLRHPLPLPEGEVDKDARGRVIVIGGSREVPGAALLAGLSALRAGAGKVQIATVESRAAALGIAMPEARVLGLPESEGGDIEASAAQVLLTRIKQEDAVLLGPGMLDDDVAGDLAAELLSSLDGPHLVVDAAALTGLREKVGTLKKHSGRSVITPHAGEMATFLGDQKQAVEADAPGAARRAAAATGAVVVMKGTCTHIASPQGQVWECKHGNVGLATSGSGDTLAGIIAGLLARGAHPLLAAQWGVYMHGEAGQRLCQSHGLLGYLAREIPFQIPKIMMDLNGRPNELQA